MNRVSSKLAVLTALFNTIAFSTFASDIRTEINQAMVERVDFGLSTSIVIGLYDKGNIDYLAYGKTDIQDGKVPNENTVFEIGSITKVMVATLLANQVKLNQLSYSSDIFTLLPTDCRSEKLKGITLEMLASHYAGLPRMPTNYETPYYSLSLEGYSVEGLCEYLRNPEDLSAPNSEYAYSNLGYGLLAYILELNTGKNLNALLKQVVTEPLNMRSTVIGIQNVDSNNLAQGHHGQVRTAYFPNGLLDGAGALLSTVSDLIQFVAAHFNEKDPILASLFNETKRPRQVAWEGTQIGLGWHIKTVEPAQKIYWHNGSTGGFYSFIGFDEQAQKAVVVLANSGGDGNDDLGMAFLDGNAKIRSTPKHVQIKLEAPQQKRFVGVYDMEFGVPMEIKLEGTQLKARFGEQFLLNLYPESTVSFFYRAFDASIEFEEGKEGMTLYLHQGGETFSAKRRTAH
ncbi:beta-lactamase family protein [Pseudoalteromonas xiamenensis]|uniref:serine hydrolase domain-containing protein n=1 Tax=Pseudoalteromonas xiamenensis TaxID=882626 RepID=UPI0027E5586B|nr:serine hydrolase domain-containing protein [Pseudoalteromonas xiamenensis]WMN60042.1 beta-lactamase family protein [Pseudoalteromonas xiamenensis]